MSTITAHAPADLAAPRQASSGVRPWLLALILLTFAMVLVGGATRLTESGLSITEWNLVAGTIPPLSDAAWESEFARYRGSPQYELLNYGMTPGEFRTIYWWEWAHRELGRFIGLFYIAGFVFFAARGALRGRRLAIFAGTGLLLATQGLVGWIMVASGLEPGMTAVAPVKLTLHLTLAAMFFAAIVALFVRLGGAVLERSSYRRRLAAKGLVGLALLQIALGGLVAGHDAGLTYNTWPLMDGRFIPAGILSLQPAWLNFVDNVATIQFSHRVGAYLLAAAVLAYALRSRTWRGSAPAQGRAALAAALVIAQIALGIATLVMVVPIELALAHQGMALILLLVLVWNASVFRRVIY